MKRVGRKETSERTGNTELKGGRSYYVYVLLCDDGSYYTGYTNNIASRYDSHKKGFGARYTRMRKPKRIVYVEECISRGDATKRERQLKKLSHREKDELASSWLSTNVRPYSTHKIC